MVTDAFLILNTFLTKFLTVLSSGASNFAVMISQGVAVLDSTASYGVSIYEMLRLDLWLQVIIILYPVYLLFLWEREGFDAMINHIHGVLNIISFVAQIFITIIQWFLNVITTIIESIPVVE